MADAAAPVVVRAAQTVLASAKRVFDAWLDPYAVGHWMFGAAIRHEEVVRVIIDARVGGRFSFLVRRMGAELNHVGEYLELVRPVRLAFTWGIAACEPSDVVVTLLAQGTCCDVILSHSLHPRWAGFAERTAQGWSTILASMARGLDAGGE